MTAKWPQKRAKWLSKANLNPQVASAYSPGLPSTLRASLNPRLTGEDGCKSLYLAAKKAGGVDVGREETDLMLEGNRPNVTIVAMHAHIIKRIAPIHGARTECVSAGAEESAVIAFNLDEPHPFARRMSVPPIAKAEGPAYFTRGRIINVARGEVQPIRVVGVAPDHYVEGTSKRLR